jgi:hypothetical protein
VEKKNPLYCATRKKERKYTLRFKFSSLELWGLNEVKFWNELVVLVRSSLSNFVKYTEVEQGSYIYWTVFYWKCWSPHTHRPFELQ